MTVPLELYQKFLENIPDAAMVVNPAGKIVVANHQVQPMLGYTPKELVGKNLSILIPAGKKRDHTQLVKSFFHNPISRPMGSGLDLSVLRKGGEKMAVDIMLNPIEVEGKPLVLLMLHEMPQQEQESHSLQEQEEELDHRVRGRTAELKLSSESLMQEIAARERAADMLLALNQAAVSMQSATNPQDMFLAVSDELKKIDLDCVVFALNQESTHLSLEHMSFSPRLIRTVEKLSGVQAKDFSFSIAKTEPIRRVILTLETVFDDNVGNSIKALLPQKLASMADKVVALLNIPNTINAPLIVSGELIGLFSIPSTI